MLQLTEEDYQKIEAAKVTTSRRKLILDKDMTQRVALKGEKTMRLPNGQTCFCDAYAVLSVAYRDQPELFLTKAQVLDGSK